MIEWGYAPNCQETTPTQGTGDYALAGAVPDFEALRDRYADGARPFLVITDGNGNREWGVYTITHGDPDTLARTQILGSTNGGAAVNWPDTSDKHVYSAPLPEIENGTVTLFAGESRPDWLPANSAWLKTDAAPGPALMFYDGVADLPLGARENLLINGDFRVAQRGTSFAAVASGDTTLDCWRYFKTGAMVHTIAQSADVPSVAEAGLLATASLHVDCTTADASLDSTDNALIIQRIEGLRARAVLQREFTLTCWVKASKPGVYCVAFRNAGPDFRSCVAEYTIEAAGVWERKTIVVPASPVDGDWNYDTGIGLQVVFTLAAGAGLQTTPGEWQAGNFVATANQVNACDSTANDFRLAMVQLVPGAGRVPFRPRDYAAELRLCQRYLQVLGGGSSERIAMGQCLGTTSATVLVIPVVPMRADPTVSISAAGDFNVTGSTGSGVAVTGLVGGGASPRSVALNVTVASGLTAGHATRLGVANTDARIVLSAEL